MVLPPAEFFHADFVSLASEYPPIDVPEPGSVAGPAALLPQRNQIALFLCHTELAAIATVAVCVNSHAPDSFVQWGHSARSVCSGRGVAVAVSPSFSSKRRISAWVRGIPRRAQSASSDWRADCSFSILGANRWSRNSR